MDFVFGVFRGGVHPIQRILEAENLLSEVTRCIEPTEDERSLQDRQQPETTRYGDFDDRRNDAQEVNGPQAPPEAEAREDKGERSGEEKLEQQQAAEELLLPDTKNHRSKGEAEMKEERKENSDGGIDPSCGGVYDPCGGKDYSTEDGDFIGDCYINENEGDLLAQVCVDLTGLPLCHRTEMERCFTIDIFLLSSPSHMLLW